MKELTNEEFEGLKNYEDRLNTASKSSYVRAIPSAVVHRMREIYSRLIESNYSMNESCSGCVLTLCKKLYVPYEKYKQRYTTGQSFESDDDSTDAVGRKDETANPTVS